MKIPVVDIGNCTLCGGCIEVCPQVFFLNETGFIEVTDRTVYPEDEVDEAIKYCPEDCISWDEY
ncbi:MAG: ferredoxin [Deltaproteobacteria bacterium]|nr:ferredoxin [Deltaproteobacteria bacterium]